jgi:hypothetical protein
VAIPVVGFAAGQPRPPLERARAADVPTIVALLHHQGARRALFPAYAEADFVPGTPLTQGFRLADLLVYRREGRVTGVAGLWDRTATKQAVVRAYSRPLRWARPWFNAAARVVGTAGLPAPGRPLPLAYASFVAVADDEPAIFRSLLRGLCGLAAGQCGFLVVDLAENDPLLSVARGFPHFAYWRRLYAVAFAGGPDLHPHVVGRVPYVETAAL